jgi:hypothetical protein
MYGTVARLQVKPGMVEKLQEWGSTRDAATIPGYVTQYVLQTDKDPNELYLIVVFTDKASYMANAQSPVQHEHYLEFRSMLAADPEWHDGEVVHAAEAVSHGL